MRLLTGIEAPYTTDALLQAAASTAMDDPEATIRVLDIAHHTIAAERQQASDAIQRMSQELKEAKAHLFSLQNTANDQVAHASYYSAEDARAEIALLKEQNEQLIATIAELRQRVLDQHSELQRQHEVIMGRTAQ
jgi:translation initiation factor 2B subunit (eIF-2B alpha/beta/delta family)